MYPCIRNKINFKMKILGHKTLTLIQKMCNLHHVPYDLSKSHSCHIQNHQLYFLL